MSKNYEILSLLSTSGSVRLFNAREKTSNLEAHLRRFDIEQEESGALQEILDAVNQTRHPNLETVLETGKDDEGWYAVVEVPQGMPLSEMLKRGPLTVAEFDQLVQQTLAAVSVLHEQRIAHLGLRPEVIWVQKRQDASMKVTVGGIGEGQTRSVAGASKHLEGYRFMAPEFWRQEPIGRRTDVYALGCTFYEALAGRAPFNAKNAEELRQSHLSPNVTPLASLAPHVQAWVTAWVTALMESEPSSRLRNAKAARSRYDLGVHGMAPGMTVPQPAGLYAPVPGYGYPVAGYPAGYVLSQPIQPAVEPFPTGQVPAQPAPASAPVSATVTGTAAVTTAAAATSRTPASRTTAAQKPPAAPAAHSGMGGIYMAAGAFALLLLALLFFLNSGRENIADQQHVPAAEPSTSSPPEAPPATVPAVSNAGEATGPFFPRIEDALPTTSALPLYERSNPPNMTNLVAWFSSRELAQTYPSADSQVGVSASPGGKVFLWKDLADAAGELKLQGDRKLPGWMPTLNVVRIEPGGREHPVITFHESEALGGKSPEGAGKMPFDPALREKGVTIVQVLRCRPVAGLLTRTVRLGTMSNQKIAIIQVSDNGTFLANLGRQSNYLPPVRGDHGRFCIVALVWNADEGWARISCRTADGTVHLGDKATQVPDENEVGERLQIGDVFAPLTTPGYKFNGDVLETLVYNRGLKDDERQRVESWLSEYYFGHK